MPKAEVALLGPGEFAWTNDYSFMRTMTCKNHPTARYMTKNPFDRSLHVVKLPEGDIERSDTGECVCPIGDLVPVVDAKAVELVAQFNSEAFRPEDVEGTPENGPDFNHQLYLLTGNRDGDWIEVQRRLPGMFDPDVQWIRKGESAVVVRESPLDDDGDPNATEG